MKIKLNNPYGYKLCYSYNKNKRRLYEFRYTNTYDLALFEKKHCEKIYNLFNKITWYILPIKKKEYNKIWKDCPF